MPKPAAELQLNQCDAIERWHALLEEVKGALCMIFFSRENDRFGLRVNFFYVFEYFLCNVLNLKFLR